MIREVAMDAAAAQAFDLVRLDRAFLDDPYPATASATDADRSRRRGD
jgi:hypothetical protein